MSKLARHEPLTPDSIREQMETSGFLGLNAASLMKVILEHSRDYRNRGQMGRLRAALLTGTTIIGSTFITKAERQGLLLTDDMPVSAFGQFLIDLHAEVKLTNDSHWMELSQRLETYRNYWRLVDVTSAAEKEVISVLSKSPRFVIKRVLAFTHLCFLRNYLSFDVPSELERLFEELGTPEEVASIASLLIAVANAHSPLDSFELGLPIIDLMDSDLHDIMRSGKALLERFEIGKQVSLFAYSLEFIQSPRGHVFYVRPPSSTFEYALRLGFIRFQFGKGGFRTYDPEFPQVSLQSFAEVFAGKLPKSFCEVADPETDYRRIRLHLPLGPEPYRAVTGAFFFEDAVEQEQLGQEFLLPVRGESDPEPRLTDHLDFNTFLRIWRHWQFLGLVDAAVTRRFVDRDWMIVSNSLVRVVPEESLIEMSMSTGVTEQQARDFLRFVAADVKKLGYFDLQYRPFLRMASVGVSKLEYMSPPEILYLPAVVSLSNAIRNVQSANQLRLGANAKIFVDVVARILKGPFKRVAVNRRVKADDEITDIDIVVLEGSNLYLLECKHALSPTGPHEIREIWEQIEKGTRQLQTAVKVLGDPARLQSYIAGWFPGVKSRQTQGLMIKTCILCSHRIFSGMSHHDIPIRDFASLSKVASDGIVGMGALHPDGDIVKYCYRVTSEGGFSAADFDDYLSENSRYFNLNARFMNRVSRFDRFGDVTVAWDTYMFDVELHEWMENAESLGFVRLPDERRKPFIPWSSEELAQFLQRSTEQAPESSSAQSVP